MDPKGADRFDARLEQSRRKAETATVSIGSSLRSLAVGMAVWNEVIGSVGQLIQMVGSAALLIPQAGDAMTSSIATINNQLENTPEAERVYNRLYDAVRITGAGLDEASKSFAKWNITLQDVGKTTDDTVDLVTGLGAAFAASGKGAGEINSIVEQLGDAMSSRKLSGDEFRSLKDAFPEFLLSLRQALGKTSEELEDLADKQKLSLDLWLDPLMQFAREGFGKLERSPLTMGRAWAGLSTTFKRFLADLDKAFGFSERIAKAIKAVSDTLNRWRSHINTLRDFVASLGDLRTHLAAALTMIYAFAGAKITGLLLSFGLLAVKVALVAAAFLLIEDFFGWLAGKDSLIGRVFGEFGDVKAGIISQFEAVKASVLDFWMAAFSPEARAALSAITTGFSEFFQMVIAGWGNILQGAMSNWRQLLAFGNWLDDLFLRLIRYVRDDLVGAFNTVTGSIGSMYRAAQTAFNFIVDMLGRLRAGNQGATGGVGDPGGSGFQLQNLVPNVSPGTAIGPSSYNGSQSNDIDITVAVNATGTSGAEVAAGARAGVGQAARDMISDLAGVARGLGVSMPRVEVAAA